MVEDECGELEIRVKYSEETDRVYIMQLLISNNKHIDLF